MKQVDDLDEVHANEDQVPTEGQPQGIADGMPIVEDEHAAPGEQGDRSQGQDIAKREGEGEEDEAHVSTHLAVREVESSSAEGVDRTHFPHADGHLCKARRRQRESKSELFLLHEKKKKDEELLPSHQMRRRSMKPSPSARAPDDVEEEKKADGAGLFRLRRVLPSCVCTSDPPRIWKIVDARGRRIRPRPVSLLLH